MTRQADLSGKHAVVAGGTSGIGEATAAAFAAAGADVLVTGRDATRLAASTARSGARGLACDATSENDRARLAADVGAWGAADAAGSATGTAEAAGTIDFLVLSLSGASGGGPFAALDLDGLRAAFEGKLWPQLAVLQALLPQLADDASVVFVSAASARAALPGTTGLAALNGALEAAIRPLATELAPRRVNAVSPGVIDTPWWAAAPADLREQTYASIAETVPAGRVGTPQDVASAILLLATNPYITGTTVAVDGGLTLPRGG
jgi:NAD(P)-dependent dehydrogenase (short-subunit alcohol dehydrogenase family)